MPAEELMGRDQSGGGLGKEIIGQRYEKTPSIVCKMKPLPVCRFWHLNVKHMKITVHIFKVNLGDQ